MREQPRKTWESPFCRVLIAIIQGVAGAAHRGDGMGLGPSTERPPKPADMDVNGALIDIDVATPYAIEQLLARENAAGSLPQIFEQPIFGGAKIDRAAGPRYPLSLPVHLQIAKGEHIADLRRRCAAQ